MAKSRERKPIAKKKEPKSNRRNPSTVVTFSDISSSEEDEATRKASLATPRDAPTCVSKATSGPDGTHTRRSSELLQKKYEKNVKVAKTKKQPVAASRRGRSELAKTRVSASMSKVATKPKPTPKARNFTFSDLSSEDEDDASTSAAVPPTILSVDSRISPSMRKPCVKTSEPTSPAIDAAPVKLEERRDLDDDDSPLILSKKWRRRLSSSSEDEKEDKNGNVSDDSFESSDPGSLVDFVVDDNEEEEESSSAESGDISRIAEAELREVRRTSKKSETARKMAGRKNVFLSSSCTSNDDISRTERENGGDSSDDEVLSPRLVAKEKKIRKNNLLLHSSSSDDETSGHLRRQSQQEGDVVGTSVHAEFYSLEVPKSSSYLVKAKLVFDPPSSSDSGSPLVKPSFKPKIVRNLKIKKASKVDKANRVFEPPSSSASDSPMTETVFKENERPPLEETSYIEDVKKVVVKAPSSSVLDRLVPIDVGTTRLPSTSVSSKSVFKTPKTLPKSQTPFKGRSSRRSPILISSDEEELETKQEGPRRKPRTSRRDSNSNVFDSDLEDENHKPAVSKDPLLNESLPSPRPFPRIRPKSVDEASKTCPGLGTPSSARTPLGPKSIPQPKTCYVPRVGKAKEKANQVSFLESLSSSIPEGKTRNPEAERFILNFHRLKHELTQVLFTYFNETVFDKKLPTDLPILWNKRLLKTAGYCRYKRQTTLAGSVSYWSSIELSEKILDSAERTRDTLLHELCHAIVWTVHGVNEGHGKLWKFYAKKAAFVHRELPLVTRCHSYAIATKFLYVCKGCGYSIGRHSKSLDTVAKVCGKCHGTFECRRNTDYGSGSRGDSGASRPSSGYSTPNSTPVTPRTPNAFALFVKENYSTVKKDQKELKHGDIMRILSKNFSEKVKV